MGRHYLAIAECPTTSGEAWWISFPSFPGVTSAAETAMAVLPQARDALESAVEAILAEGRPLPASVEEAGLPPHDLLDYEHPKVLFFASPDVALHGG